MSIRALNFNMMISNKKEEKDPGTLRRVSLLSRASSNYVSSNRNNRTSIVANKNYDRSSKLLNLYLGPQQQTSNRDSCFYMAGIDEKEEYDETSHGTNNSGRLGGTQVSSSRASHVKNYDF